MCNDILQNDLIFGMIHVMTLMSFYPTPNHFARWQGLLVILSKSAKRGRDGLKILTLNSKGVGVS